MFYLRLITTPELFPGSYLGVEVTSADTTIIPYPQLRYSKDLSQHYRIGCWCNEDVKIFRFGKTVGSTFDFAQARLMVKIWVFRKDGTRIAHEIEQWDAVKKRAAVWVRRLWFG